MQWYMNIERADVCYMAAGDTHVFDVSDGVLDDLRLELCEQVEDGLGVVGVPDEGVLQELPGRRPLVGVLGQAGLDKVVEVLGPLGGTVEGRRIRLLDPEEDPHRRQLVVGRLHLGELDEADAQRPDVNLEVVGLVAERLAKHNLQGNKRKCT